MGQGATPLKGVRVSFGTAIELGLIDCLQKDAPTTAYLFLINNGCRGKCAFCPQSIGISKNISRVSWPEFPVEEVLKGLRKNRRFRRICLQCADEEGLMNWLPCFVESLRDKTDIPISISMPPAPHEDLRVLKVAGIDVLTIPLDCADEELFRRVKGRDWGSHWRALEKALEIFGPNNVGTHIIAGLGETERDIVNLVSKCHRIGIMSSLFAFTPIMGTPLWGRPQPDLRSYRRLQLARELIISGRATERDFTYDSLGRIVSINICRDEVEDVIEEGEAFMTRGCPSCNRPYFNEKVTGPIYNYPRKLESKEVEEIRRELFGGFEGLKV
ncbi:MAG: radical SAM protein [Candidatus Methanomethyliaceae archaeon]|nr:radical SAM protein [Candidatus Methanomethyliaceae archaeon]